MIQRVYEQSLKSRLLSDVVVATDDQRIFDAVVDFGGKVMMTSSEHNSGTDRCCEIVEKIGCQYDAVVNIQGDEPFINPEQIDQIAELLPGANCGGCGYDSCRSFAKALIDGRAENDMCVSYMRRIAQDKTNILLKIIYIQN